MAQSRAQAPLDDRITSAGVGNAPLDKNDPDPWARYRTAGLDPDTFQPLLL
jgi:hypothetical protein